MVVLRKCGADKRNAADQGGAGGLELRHILFEHRIDLSEVLRFRLRLHADGLAQDADARPLEPIFVEETRVAAVHHADPEGSHRVLRVIAHHGVQKQGEVLHVSRHGSHLRRR